MSTTRKRGERAEAKAACEAFIKARDAHGYPGTLAGEAEEDAAYRLARAVFVRASAVYFGGKRATIAGAQKAMRATRSNPPQTETNNAA